MARHEAPPNTFDATVSDYVTQRARELIRQAERGMLDQVDGVAFADAMAMANWIGAAAEILRELTRDA